MGYALFEAASGWIFDPLDATDRVFRESILLFDFPLDIWV